MPSDFSLYSLLRPILFKLSPELSHNLALQALRLLGLCQYHRQIKCYKPVTIAGLEFPNPVGAAAGFDKDGLAMDGLFALGFGSVEIGTVTPYPQQGNPQPRLFRLPEWQGIINRMGFNNQGVDAMVKRLRCYQKRRCYRNGIIGVNIGVNRNTQNMIADYLHCFKKLYGLADYFAVNVSSPNTPGLRDLQNRDNLKKIFAPILEYRIQQGKQDKDILPPVFLKIDPDMTEQHFEDIVRFALDWQIDGIIATNTTLKRPNLSNPHANEPGGLSGSPLTEPALTILSRFQDYLQNQVPLIGVGGIMNAQHALERQQAGAIAVQVYSGLIYHGWKLIPEILHIWPENISAQ